MSGVTCTSITKTNSERLFVGTLFSQTKVIAIVLQYVVCSRVAEWPVLQKRVVTFMEDAKARRLAPRRLQLLRDRFALLCHSLSCELPYVYDDSQYWPQVSYQNICLSVPRIREVMEQPETTTFGLDSFGFLRDLLPKVIPGLAKATHNDFLDNLNTELVKNEELSAAVQELDPFKLAITQVFRCSRCLRCEFLSDIDTHDCSPAYDAKWHQDVYAKAVGIVFPRGYWNSVLWTSEVNSEELVSLFRTCKLDPTTATLADVHESLYWFKCVDMSCQRHHNSRARTYFATRLYGAVSTLCISH